MKRGVQEKGGQNPLTPPPGHAYVRSIMMWWVEKITETLLMTDFDGLWLYFLVFFHL